MQVLLEQGIDLMLFGMGTVFVFLTLLVLATGLMSSLIQRFFPEPEIEAPLPQNGRLLPAKTVAVDTKTLSVIKAAIEQHRAKR
jgi:oxaloacetate decarboxylase (Na+ extruding) subunit gamma